MHYFVYTLAVYILGTCYVILIFPSCQNLFSYYFSLTCHTFKTLTLFAWGILASFTNIIHRFQVMKPNFLFLIMDLETIVLFEV